MPVRPAFLDINEGANQTNFVSAPQNEPLPSEAKLALAWSPPKLRAPLSIALQLDQRLARIVTRTTEPMLGQMRLAWWRDALGTKPADRPRGDAVLDAIGAHWAGREAALIAMVDGWEVLVVADRLGPDETQAFASGRGAFFGTLADDCTPVQAGRIAAASNRWALADAAAAVSDDAERALLVETGLALGRREQSGPEQRGSVRMPRDMRGLAVLNALAQRALQRGGRPLMEGRGAPLAALRAAIFLM